MACKEELEVGGTVPSQQLSRLLQLPAEIRDMIWIISARIQNKMHHFEDETYNPTTSHELIHPLRVTCRMINMEVSPRIFNFTEISLDEYERSHARFFTWLERIGEPNRLAIHRFRPIYTAETAPSAVSARKWARVLKALPNLLHIYFPSREDLDPGYWQEAIENDRSPLTGFRITEVDHEVRTVSCFHSNVVSWSMKRGSASMIGHIVAIDSLRALQISLKDYQREHVILPKGPFRSLKHLHLGWFPGSVWCHFASDSRSLCEPPKALQPGHFYKASEPQRIQSISHTSRIHVRLLHDLTFAFGDDNALAIDFSPLLKDCPNLTYLALECGRNCGLMDHFPETLETMALLFDFTVDMETLANKLLSVPGVCRKLAVLAIIVNWCKKDEWDKEVRDRPEPLICALETLKRRGIHVAYFPRFNGYVDEI